MNYLEVFEKVQREFYKEPKITRCLNKLIDVINEENLHNIISAEHSRNNHRGIDENFAQIKSTYYYPKLKEKITEFINNCEICNLAKYERKPQSIPYMISETPKVPNEIIHMDVFYSINKSLFITMIDKFTKIALITKIENRSDPEFRKAILRYISTYGHIKKIITDNELGMKSKGMNKFLKDKNIEIHFTSSLNHNSNSDVERLHNTINEHLRILKHTMRHIPIEEQMILINGYYNETIHSTTNMKPIDFVNGKINEKEYNEIHEKLVKKKELKITKLNESRTNDIPIEDGINYIKETRGGKNYLKFRKIVGTKVDDNHLKDENSNHIYYKTHVKKRKRFQNPDSIVFPTQQTSRRGNVLDTNNN